MVITSYMRRYHRTAGILGICTIFMCIEHSGISSRSWLISGLFNWNYMTALPDTTNLIRLIKRITMLNLAANYSVTQGEFLLCQHKENTHTKHIHVTCRELTSLLSIPQCPITSVLFFLISLYICPYVYNYPQERCVRCIELGNWRMSKVVDFQKLVFEWRNQKFFTKLTNKK